MAAKIDVQQFLEERQEVLTRKFEAGDVNEIMKCYDDQDVDFSDHAWQADHLNRTDFISFLHSTYATVPGLKMVTHGVNGTKEFSVWEWTLKFVAKENDEIRGLMRGKEMWLRGCSLHWWKVRDGGDEDIVADWKIWKEGDYAGSVPVGKSE